MQCVLHHLCRRIKRAAQSDAQRHRACRQIAGTRASSYGIERSHAHVDQEFGKSRGRRKLRNGRFVARRNQATRKPTRQFAVKFSNVMSTGGEWLRGEGPHHQIVISSRVRIARNLRHRAFPGWAKKAERTQILELIKPRDEELPEMQDSFSELLQDLSALEKQVLVERHLISSEHAAQGAGSGVVMNRRQTLSIM